MRLPGLCALFLFPALIACTSLKPVEFSEYINPVDEGTRLRKDLDQAIVDQYDVLAPEALFESERYWQLAKREENGEGRRARILKELGYCQAYFNRAKAQFTVRHVRVEDVLAARRSALQAGAQKLERAGKELAALDDSFRRDSHLLDKARDPEIWDRLRQRYAGLELTSIEEVQLGGALAHAEKAKQDGAGKYSPLTLKEATDAVEAAKSAIAAHPHDEASYRVAVARANRLAGALVSVTATARVAAGESNEEVARELLAKDRTVRELNQALKGTTAEVELEGQALAARNSELRVERELENARHRFTFEEAEVYRQGNKLLIRLKQMDFASGQATVRAGAQPLLQKVKSVIQDLNSHNVVVEGHTDGVGGEAANRKLSQQRADVVAKYLAPEVAQVKAVGFGFRRPLTSDKSARGRAENRRVDVIITAE